MHRRFRSRRSRFEFDAKGFDNNRKAALPQRKAVMQHRTPKKSGTRPLRPDVSGVTRLQLSFGRPGLAVRPGRFVLMLVGTLSRPVGMEFQPTADAPRS
jgi:hypothetical protein